MNSSHRLLAVATVISLLCGCTMLGSHDRQTDLSIMSSQLRERSSGNVAFLSVSGERSTTWIELAPRGD
jgi:hypothetical protein